MSGRPAKYAAGLGVELIIVFRHMTYSALINPSSHTHAITGLIDVFIDSSEPHSLR
jgi:hypothetical protein